jgi:hypothetical protein
MTPPPDMSDLDIPRTHDGPGDDSSASVAADKYDQMLALADLFDSSGTEMRTRARLGRPRRTSGPPPRARAGC